jgi:two-component system response regulator YesN
LEEKKNVKYDTIIKRVNEIINLKYADQSLSVDNIAEMIGISTPYICRIYKQNTLHTILDDIVKKRMEKAREFLLETDFAIDEIAVKIGFSNSSYFYKAFKVSNGVTPSEYRKIKK